MKHTKKKLMLNKETIRYLDNGELNKVAGGAASSWDGCICSSPHFETSTCPTTRGLTNNCVE